MSAKTPVVAALAALGGLIVGILWGTSGDEPPRKARTANDGPKAVLVIHGGAGVWTDEEMKQAGTKTEEYEETLAKALTAGYEAMRKGTSVDGVEQAVRVMEDSPLFNAGKGAALAEDGKARLDASIMEGKAEPPAKDKLLGKRDPRKRAGAVGDVLHVKNPISAARAVMEMPGQRHALLVGDGAEAFVLNAHNREKYRLERVENDYFHTDWRKKLLDKAMKKRAQGHDLGGATRYGTVGAVATKDRTLAAGTSTGGLTAKLPGRVGDTPLIGAGTYADDRACAVSCTGTGEVFIRHAVAYDVVARMLYSTPKLGVVEAATQTIEALPDENDGVGSLIALDVAGNFTVAMSPEQPGTYRGYVTADGERFVGTVKGPWKSMGKVGVK